MKALGLSVVAGAAVLSGGASAATATTDRLLTRFQQEIAELAPASEAAPVEGAAESGAASDVAERIGRSILRGAALRSPRGGGQIIRFQEEPAEEADAEALGIVEGFEQSAVAVGEQLFRREFSGFGEEEPLEINVEAAPTEFADALSTPVPAAFLVMGAGLVGLSFLARRKAA